MIDRQLCVMCACMCWNWNIIRCLSGWQTNFFMRMKGNQSCLCVLFGWCYTVLIIMISALSFLLHQVGEEDLSYDISPFFLHVPFPLPSLSFESWIGWMALTMVNSDACWCVCLSVSAPACMFGSPLVLLIGCPFFNALLLKCPVVNPVGLDKCQRHVKLLLIT